MPFALIAAIRISKTLLRVVVSSNCIVVEREPSCWELPIKRRVLSQMETTPILQVMSMCEDSVLVTRTLQQLANFVVHYACLQRSLKVLKNNFTNRLSPLV